MKCALCGLEFSEAEGIRACSGCPMPRCGMVRCPNCGYESPPEPKLVRILKRWFKHEDH